MFFIDLLFAFFVALVLVLLIAGAVGWRYPGSTGIGTSALFLFLLFLALVWAGGIWSAPYGPALWGGYWLPFVVVGLFVGLLVLALGAASAAPPTETPPTETPPGVSPAEAEAADSAAAAFGVFFWLLLLAAIAAIVAGYLI